MIKRNIVHITSGLAQGGAERILKDICQVLKEEKECNQFVISLTNNLHFADDLSKIGVETKFIPFLDILQLYRYIKRLNPVVVFTWMYHANLIGGVVSKLVGVKMIIWNIHHAYVNKDSLKFTTLIIAYGSILFSYLVPRRIYYCSKFGYEQHLKIGYNKSKSLIVFNGYDSVLYKRRHQAYTIRFKGELGVNDGSFIIGHVARFDPVKDHLNFLKALKHLESVCDIKISVLMVGNNITIKNHQLQNWISDLNIRSKILLLGPQSDMIDFYSIFDLCVLSSNAEAFPNVLAESMLCEVPCVTTDVGDASLIIGEYGWISPPSNYIALSEQILSALKYIEENDRFQIGIRCRKHIIRNFELEEMKNLYLNVC